eukprot:403339422
MENQKEEQKQPYTKSVAKVNKLNKGNVTNRKSAINRKDEVLLDEEFFISKEVEEVKEFKVQVVNEQTYATAKRASLCFKKEYDPSLQPIQKQNINFVLRINDIDVIMSYKYQYRNPREQTELSMIQFLIEYYKLGDLEEIDKKKQQAFKSHASRYHVGYDLVCRVHQALPHKCDLKKVLMCIVSHKFVTIIDEEHVQVEFPNQQMYNKQSQEFWTQDIMNRFSFYNWKQVDKEQIYAFQAIADEEYQVNKQIKELMEKVKNKNQEPQQRLDYIQKLQDLNKIKEELQNYNVSHKIFQLLNDDPEILKCQLDLHYQTIPKAKEKFNEYYSATIKSIKQRELQSNTKEVDPHSYLIKVICGFGHHRQQFKVKQKNQHQGLKEAMLDYFKNTMKFDFAYLKQHGSFLIRLPIFY